MNASARHSPHWLGRGFAADAVAYIGKESWQDHSLAIFADENDYTIVTDDLINKILEVFEKDEIRVAECFKYINN